MFSGLSIGTPFSDHLGNTLSLKQDTP